VGDRSLKFAHARNLLKTAVRRKSFPVGWENCELPQIQ
jgi:hypothetical protein